MRVLLVNISLDAKLGGGTAERTRHLALHLAKAGSTCEVVAMTGNSWQQDFDEQGVKSYITGRIGQRFPIPLLNPGGLGARCATPMYCTSWATGIC